MRRSSDAPRPAPSRLARRLAAFSTLWAAAALADPIDRFDFEQRYFLDPGRIAADHTLVHDGERYHLFYTLGHQGQGWMFPGNMVDFGHAVSTDLVRWTVEPPVLSTVPNSWRERNLWAPHVIPAAEGGYLLYYTGVDSDIVQQIGVAAADELDSWSDVTPNPVYHPHPSWAAWQPGQWSNGRDPFAMRVDNVMILLTTASTRPGYLGVPSRGAVSLAFSTDGVTWVDAGAPLFVNNSYRVLESTFMYRRGSLYYLFYHEQNVPGVSYMTSGRPFSEWSKATARQFEPDGFAPELIDGPDSKIIYTRVRDAIWRGRSILGVKFDWVEWQGLTPVLMPTNLMHEDWTVLWGDAFLTQPAFGDRPADRTGYSSNIEGLFSINTAEQHGGPLEWGCPECPPDDGLTGAIRSRPFTIDLPTIMLRVGGGSDPELTYVALYHLETGTEIARAAGRGSHFLYPVAWDVSGWRDETVYLVIADLATSGPFGHISVDLIEESEGPPVAGGPGGGGAPAPGLSALAVAPSPGRAPFAIGFQLGDDSPFALRIYDLNGRLRRLLAGDRRAAGSQRLIWDGRDDLGREVAAGVYFLRLETGGERAGARVVVLP